MSNADIVERGDDSNDHHALVLRVGERLRNECFDVFGTMWDYEVAWRFAKAAINEVEKYMGED